MFIWLFQNFTYVYRQNFILNNFFWYFQHFDKIIFNSSFHRKNSLSSFWKLRQLIVVASIKTSWWNVRKISEKYAFYVCMLDLSSILSFLQLQTVTVSKIWPFQNKFRQFWQYFIIKYENTKSERIIEIFKITIMYI